jgi:hypothetical protein
LVPAAVLSCSILLLGSEPLARAAFAQDQEHAVAPESSTTAEPAKTASQILPSLRVSGTLTSPLERRALIVGVDEQGKQISSVVAKEGDTVLGYLVTRINRDQVSFERGGQTFIVAVGNDRSGDPMPSSPRMVPDVPYQRKKELTADFVPAPENLDEVKTATDAFFDRLRANPEFQQTIEKLRGRVLERLQTPAPSR